MSRKLAPTVITQPGYCFGKPHLADSRITVEAIVGRFVAGESVVSLALDYELTVLEIEEALRWAIKNRRRGT